MIEESVEKINNLKNINEYMKKNNYKIIISDLIIDNMTEALMKYKKHNILLIGEAGVGKTAIVEKYAEILNKHIVPQELREKIIYELSLNNLISGCKYRGDFEEKVEEIFNNINENSIIFIDEIHNALHCGAADGAIALG